MAHFAKIDDNNIVTEVIKIDNSITDPETTGSDTEQLGKDFIADTLKLNGTWIQCSYEGNIRNKFPAIGDTWDASKDKFIPSQPYASWSWNNSDNAWEAPIDHPLKDLVDKDFPTGYPQEFIDVNEKNPPWIYVWNETKHQADTAEPKTIGWELVEQPYWFA